MGRSRVLSFMSTFGGPPKSSSGTSSPVQQQQSPKPNYIVNPAFGTQNVNTSVSDSPPPRTQTRQRADSRPMSISAGYVGPQMDTHDTVPELLPIFNCLNSHSNKLYQEGYFLKLNDLDTQGRPYHDRSWTECFAQLVGTVLSLWDAAALDNAASDGEVPATFINLGDASIKMIETLETRSRDAQPLQNVLSISTAGKNRYLFHFSNVHALTQWTAGIRLAMFENSSLQETYTGALIGGKGKALNNIRTIMTSTKFQTSDWVRVRFGAGTPWRRCWCVISPPDEKEVAKAQKNMKKKSSYDRSQVILKGDVKFYEAKKITKKTQPIATIVNAFAAYAIYPQSKPLIEQSTLIKIEGNVVIHTQPETRLESFIFVMPETHEAVSGFEMLLRFVFPIWDVFALYGRPQRLIPDTWNPKSLMFAMPKHDRWGYLDILDVTTLVTRPGSANWSESEWRTELKKLTAERIEKLARGGTQEHRPPNQYGHAHRNSLPSRSAALKFADETPTGSRVSFGQDGDRDLPNNKPRSNTGSSPPPAVPYGMPGSANKSHGRSISESVHASPTRRGGQHQDDYHPSRLSREAGRPNYSSDEDNMAPPPPAHIQAPILMHGQGPAEVNPYAESSDEEHRLADASHYQTQAANQQSDPSSLVDKPPSPVQPVAPPPAFSHQPGAKPQTRPYQSPELRRANSRMSSATLSQLAAAAGKQGLSSDLSGGDQNLGKSNDAYSRPHPLTDHNSDQIALLAHNSGPSSGYSSDAGPSHSSTNLKAPGKQFGRSVSPLRQVAAVTPEEKSQYSYFVDNPYGAEYNREHSPHRSGQMLTPKRDQSGERSPGGSKINRKPVPPSPSKLPNEFISAQETSPTDAVRTRDVDDAILNRMNTNISKASAESRRYSGDDSNYASDAELETLPNYNERPFRERTDQPRSGKLKVVGGDTSLEESENWQVYPASGASIDIPEVDFGHTYQPELQKTPRASDQFGSSSPARKAYSPSRITDDYTRSPNRSPLRTPDGGHSRSSSNENRSVPWQPGAGSSSTGLGVTPEQFVQSKAAANRMPVYAHARQGSSTDVRTHSRQTSRTPPIAQSHGADFAGQTGIQSDPRGVSGNPPDYSRYLNAREQEHVARATGSSLITIERKPVSPGAPQIGLVGAIEAREKEKAAIKEGHGGYMVQQAIAQRQQQGYQGYDYSQPSPQYSIPGQFPQSPQYPASDWDYTQQPNPYPQTQHQAYGGPTYGRQTPQDYYSQSSTNTYTQGHNQYRAPGQSGQQSHQNHNNYRG